MHLIRVCNVCLDKINLQKRNTSVIEILTGNPLKKGQFYTYCIDMHEKIHQNELLNSLVTYVNNENLVDDQADLSRQ